MKRTAIVIALMLSWSSAVTATDRLAGSGERPSGSGVIVHSDGYVLTAHHVIANARRIVVVTPGEFRAPAIVVGTDVEHDLALLKTETVGLSEVALGHAGAVRLDQEVLAVGFPFGLREVTLTRGRIAAVRTKGVQRVFQVDAAVNPGNSGGPLFNEHGELIGILTTKFSHPSGIVPEGMAFAVPVSYATHLLANIEGFDFTSVGRMRNGKKGKKQREQASVAPLVVRTTVRIEVARAAESGPPVAPAPAASVDRHDTARAPASQGHGEARGPGSVLGDQELVRQVTEQLQHAQQEELQRLAQRGLAPPDGMVLIPGGEFWMGAEDGLPDARPMHRVYVSTYWLDRHEVTNRHYRQCVESGGCAHPKDQTAYDDPALADHPVTNVTWVQARHYCGWRGKRLPTEAEWEKAARGIDGRLYPWGNSDEVLKVRVDKTAPKNGTVPVGSLDFALSPYGVADLVMNVSEWVNDWYAEDFYRFSPGRDPQGPARGSFRVLRGGEISDRLLELRVSYRGWDDMTYWGPSLGFRCAQDGG